MANTETPSTSRFHTSLHAVVRDWKTDPLFGRVCNGETEPHQMMVSHLTDKAANIRILDENTAEVLLPPLDDPLTGSNDLWHTHPSYQLERRLAEIHETYEEWRFVGCELCYATTGEQEPGHSIDRCTRWPSSDRARRILCWLESLRIPRFFEHRGWCTHCAHGWVCDEVRMGTEISQARHSEHKAHLIQLYDSKLDPDGYCKNRPLVRRMVAAFCAYDNQILGKVLSKVASDIDGVNLNSERQGRRWFEQRIRSAKGFWVPRLILLVLDQLVLAFRFRHAERYEVAEFDWNAPCRMDNELEVEDWKTSLDSLVGQCTFCAGRGYKEELTRHTLRQCKRGGASTVRRGLGEMLYEEGFVPSGGCDVCFLPREFCARWTRTPDGKWARDGVAQCTYDVHLLFDSIIGFAECGKEKFRMDLVEGVDNYHEEQDSEKMSVDDEETAIWLSADLVVAGVQGCQMIRQLTVWTMELKSYRSRD